MLFGPKKGALAGAMGMGLFDLSWWLVNLGSNYDRRTWVARIHRW